MSESHKGKQLSDEHKKKLLESNSNREYSKETREKISKALKGKPAWNKGKHHSAETKKKIGKIHKGKILSKKLKIEVK